MTSEAPEIRWADPVKAPVFKGYNLEFRASTFAVHRHRISYSCSATRDDKPAWLEAEFRNAHSWKR